MKTFHLLSLAGAILPSTQRFAGTMSPLVAGQALNSGIKPNHMKNKRFISGLLLGLLFCLLWAPAQAAGPLWTMVPAPGSNPSQAVPANGSALIQYIVQNQSHKPKQLVIQSLPGISQTAPCQLAPRGQAGSSCTLNLTVLGSALPAGGIHGGPALCQINPDGSPNPSQCYQPSAANVLNLSVAEAPPHTTLAISNPTLTLAAQMIFTEASGAGDESACTNAGGTWINTGMPPYCQSKARKLIISNSGAVTAMDVNYTIAPALPAGTMVSPASCGNIPAGGTCELTVTSGNTPSAAANMAPVPSVLTVQGSNTPTAVTSGIVVLTYGNRYQGGFVFAIDDSTTDTMSVVGKVAAFEDQVAPPLDGIIWSSDSQGNAAFHSIWGIDETSTTASPSPSTPSAEQLAGQENCNGATDGQCNTNNILIFYSPPNSVPAIDPNFYAAGLCSATIADFNDWYLPAICDMGFAVINPASVCGSEASPALQNMQSNLVDNGDVGSLAGGYWSSTEHLTNPQGNAWLQLFAAGVGSNQGIANKGLPFSVRCVRAF